MTQFSKEEALTLLQAADITGLSTEDIAENEGELSIWQNDVWAWALSFASRVTDEDLPEMARLFWWYGNAGLMYWVSEQHEQMRSEFHDNNRAIDFVRMEENLRKEVPDYNARAYKKVTYTLGEL